MNAPIDIPAPRGLLTLALAELDTASAYQQRRTKASAEADAGLAASIGTMGVLTPILVRWGSATERHQVVDGHRRVAAALAAGLSHVPAVELASDERATLAAGVAANTQRAPLAPVDLWRAIVALQDRGWTLDGAAAALGVAKRLARQLDKLGRLHPDMLGAIAAHEMPEEDALAIIAGAPPEVQQAAVQNPNCWDDDWDPKEGTGTARKVPDWYAMADACRVTRIPQSRAIFDPALISDLVWEEDLFAQPDDPDRITTTDIAGFLTVQNAALVARSNRARRQRAVEWSRKDNGPALPAGWTRCFDPKTPGAVRFAAVKPEGHGVGAIVEVYAVPPPEPAKKAAEARKESPPVSGDVQDAGADAPGADDAGEEGEDEDDAPLPEAATLEPPPAKPGRGPMTEKGRILLAEAKTTAIRCALRDRRNFTASDLLIVLVLALAGDNVEVRGDPASKYTRTRFTDLAARLVAPDGSEELDISDDDILSIAAEAAARMIVCAPTGFDGNSSGAAAEWIGAVIEAHRDMPRLDTPEMLATLIGDALRAAAREAGLPVGGSSKALRERLAGHAEEMTLPGGAFAAPGPPRATLRPEGHVGPFPCEACSHPEDCIEEVACERAEDGDDE